MHKQEAVCRDAAEGAQDLLEFGPHRRFGAFPQDSKAELLSWLGRDHEFVIQMCQDIDAEVKRRNSDKLTAMTTRYVVNSAQRTFGESRTGEAVESYLSELDGKPRSS